jgi:rhodanese-related sulfurtransferase
MEKIKENTTRIFAIFILFIIIFIAIFYLFYYDNPYTTTYENIEAEKAYILIKNSSKNLTVIDIRGLEEYNIDQFNEGHLPNAIFNNTASDFFESKNDILVYSINGTVGQDFCEQLKGKVYGKIYNLQGGYELWESQGYTLGFINLTAEEAYELINNTKNLIIVDCRGLDYTCSSCLRTQYENGHLEGAILESQAPVFKNETNDFLVYSEKGNHGFTFCGDLINYVDGIVYNMIGGINAWKEQGFPTKSGSEP